MVFDWTLALAGVGIAVWRLAPTIAGIRHPAAVLAGLHWLWLAVAVPAGFGGLMLYGEVHRQLLRAGGARASFGAVQAVNFVGNAITLTVPSAGVTAGAAYAVAAYRHRGIDTGLALWAVTVAAMISGLELVVAGPLVLAADGLLSLVGAAALSGAIAVGAAGLGWALRRPRSVRAIVRTVIAVGRHVPVLKNAKWVRAGVDRVSDRIALLRPTVPAWARVFGVALLSWLVDYMALVACVLAVTGDPGHLPWAAVGVGYLAVQAGIGLQLTPAGAGAADSGLLAALVAGGLTDPVSAIVVVLYRVIAWPMLAASGWLVFVTTARRPSGRRRSHRRRQFGQRLG
jgi:uncharacterized membrane protein YbhN (UPF0104 family)